MVIVRIHMQQHQAKRNVAGLHVLIPGTGISKRRRHFSVNYVPNRLGQKHATHVAVPRGVVVTVELVDVYLSRSIMRRRHGRWAHNLLSSEADAENEEEESEAKSLREEAKTLESEKEYL